MTANDTTPPEGKDSIDRWRNADVSFPFRNESNEDATLTLEGSKTETKESVDDVTRALLNEDVTLTDEKLRRMMEAAEAIEAIYGTLVQRVPNEGRVDRPDRDDPDGQQF